MQSVTASEFNQYTSRVRKMLESGSVTITDRGEPSMVLMTWEKYQLLVTDQPSLPDLLSRTPGIADIDLELDRPDLEPRPLEWDELD